MLNKRLINFFILFFCFFSLTFYFSTAWFSIVKFCFIPIIIYLFYLCYQDRFQTVVNMLKSPFFIWYFSFWIFILIVTLCNHLGTLGNSLNTFLVISLYVLVFSILYKKENIESEMLFQIITLVSFFACIWLFISDFSLLIQGERIGFHLTGNNPNYIGTILSIYTFFLLYHGIYDRSKFSFLVFVLTCVAVLLTGSKHAIIITLISFMQFLIKDGRIEKQRIIYFIALTSIALILIFIIPVLYENIARRFLSLLGGMGILDFSTDHSTSLRTIYFEQAIALWKQQPFFGFGFDGFRMLSGFHTYSHNNYTELLTTVGMIGFLFYYGFFIVLIKKALCHRSSLHYLFFFLLTAFILSDTGAVCFTVYPLYYIILFITSENIDWNVVNGK